MEKEHDITLLDSLGYNNTFALAMKPEVAKKYSINSMSDLSKFSSDLILSCTLEFENREDAFIGLSKLYNMKFKDTKAIDGSLRYLAIENNEAQVIDTNSTEGLIKKYKLKILKDDKGFFPPYYAVPMVREETLEKYPELKDILNMLSNKLDQETMIELNYQVDELGKSPEDVAHEYLVKEGLVK